MSQITAKSVFAFTKLLHYLACPVTPEFYSYTVIKVKDYLQKHTMAVVISTQQLESSLLEIDEYANAEIEKLTKDRDTQIAIITEKTDNYIQQVRDKAARDKQAAATRVAADIQKEASAVASSIKNSL